ncbi:MAG: methionyl-tRNA formyltransferase [Succinivibrio sp.]
MQNRIIFAGTPDFAATHLQKLLDTGIIPVAVYTQPDRPAGRGHRLTPSPVKKIALENGIEVYTPENFRNEEDIKKFESHKADLCIVVAYGIILPQRVIDAPVHGCINVHGSLLPKYRGAAPIQRALLDGEEETGISIMKVGLKLDAGDVYSTVSSKITSQDTSESLFERLAQLGANELVRVIPEILNDNMQATAQDEALVTYARKISKDEAEIDFNQEAQTVDRTIRGLNPWPVATAVLNDVKYKIFMSETNPEETTELPAGSIVSIDKKGINVACANGVIRLITIQAPGKGPVRAADLARSKKDDFKVGMQFV